MGCTIEDDVLVTYQSALFCSCEYNGYEMMICICRCKVFWWHGFVKVSNGFERHRPIISCNSLKAVSWQLQQWFMVVLSSIYKGTKQSLSKVTNNNLSSISLIMVAKGLIHNNIFWVSAKAGVYVPEFSNEPESQVYQLALFSFIVDNKYYM